MNLTESDLTIDYDVIRMVSDNNKWEFGAYRVMFGVRIGASLIGTSYRAIQYCAGSDQILVTNLLVTAQAIMLHLPESITERELEDLMPKCSQKPIDRDPCWEKLQKLAAKLATKTQEKTMKFKIGDEVKRDCGETYQENECGTIIEIDQDQGRARVQWKRNRTWYAMSRLLKA